MEPPIKLVVLGTDLFWTSAGMGRREGAPARPTLSAGDTLREKAQRLRIQLTCSAPQYELPCRGELAIFGLVLNDLLCQRSVDFRVGWEEG